MMENKDVLITEAVDLIDKFYHGSFKLPPQKCTPFIAAFVDKVTALMPLFNPHQMTTFNSFLHKTIEALQAQDYVLVKDYLKYEIRPILVKLAKKGS